MDGLALSRFSAGAAERREIRVGEDFFPQKHKSLFCGSLRPISGHFMGYGANQHPSQAALTLAASGGSDDMREAPDHGSEANFVHRPADCFITYAWE